MIENILKAETTTQTGVDQLCSCNKQEASEYLRRVWQIVPRWIPQPLGIISYPFISSQDFEKIAGPNCPLSRQYRQLLDVQREKGFLGYTDMPREKLSGEDHIDLIGAHGNGNEESKRFLLDPVLGKFIHVPDSEEGIRKYNEFYTSRMGYIEAILNGYKLIGREKLYDLSSLDNVPAVELFYRNIVIVCGLGTGGGETAIRLGKQMPGVNLALIDGGVFGPENVDRQVATPFDVGLNKALKVASTIYSTNPMLPNPICVPFHLSEENIENTLNNLIKMYRKDKSPVIQIVDEIDITEKSTLYAKALLHEIAIKIAKDRESPIYVHWSIDVGASGEVVGTCRYTGREKNPLGGRYTKRHAQISPMLAVSQLIPKRAVGLDMIEDIKRRFSSGSQLRHVSQTGLSAIGVAKAITTRVILTAMGYGPKLNKLTCKDDVRHSLTTSARFLAAMKLFPMATMLSMRVKMKRNSLLKSKLNKYEERT